MNSSADSSTRPKLLVIDDDPQISEVIETIGRDTGFEVTVVNNHDLIRTKYRGVQPDFITLDLDLGVDEGLEIAERGYDGLEVLQFLASQQCQSGIVIISGSSKDKRLVTVKIGKELGLDIKGSMGKPFKVTDFEKLLNLLLQNKI